jgi:hypothetical protein
MFFFKFTLRCQQSDFFYLLSVSLLKKMFCYSTTCVQTSQLNLPRALGQLEHVFITSKSWRNMGGLPGLCLSGITQSVSLTKSTKIGQFSYYRTVPLRHHAPPVHPYSANPLNFDTSRTPVLSLSGISISRSALLSKPTKF